MIKKNAYKSESERGEVEVEVEVKVEGEQQDECRRGGSSEMAKRLRFLLIITAQARRAR